jgi:hypothetical protein
MEPVIISWTPTNWATIFLMALGGLLVLKLALLAAQRVRNGQNPPAQSLTGM